MDLEQRLTKAESRLGRTVIKLDEVEAENAALRAQLDLLIQQSVGSKHVGGTRPNYPSPATSTTTEAFPDTGENGTTGKHEALVRKYAQLQSSYATLQTEHDACCQQIETAQKTAERALDKAREYKRAAREWKKYSEHRENKRKIAQAFASTQTDGVPCNRASKVAEARTSERTSHALTTIFNTIEDKEMTKSTTCELPSSPPRFHEKGDAPKAASLPDLAMRRTTSSQTTVEPTQNPDAPIEAGPSSDFEPIFVHARSLKRKRDRAPVEASPPRRVKQEPHASAPAHVIEVDSDPVAEAHMTREGVSDNYVSDDLDKIGPGVVTPRRAKRVQDLHPRAGSEEITRRIPALSRAVSSLSDGNICDQPSASEPSRSKAVRQSELLRQNTGASDTGKSWLPTLIPDRAAAAVLQQISPNVPLAPRDKSTIDKAKSRLPRSDHVRLLSEASDISSQVSLQQKQLQHVSGAEAEDQLEELLNEPTTKRTPVLLRGPQNANLDNQKTAVTTQLVTPVSDIKRVSPTKRRFPLERDPRLHDSPPPINPDDEPLRSRDVRTLKLEDFKINPQYLGTDYAFADTVRGKDQRKALHVCAKPECCGGALAKVIAMGGSSLSGKSDEQALDAFVGSNWRDRIGSANADERKQLITQAHAYCFANQHGKHRQAFERQSTPPGFWRTDFPTTQETEKDREKAQEMEREIIRERYCEAMREGGRWKFRDE